MPKLTQPIVVCLTFVLLAGLLAGCIPPATNQLGPRPAPDTLGAVEAYLQKYQPGPLPRVFQTSRLYDRHGALLAERWSDGRRTWVPLNRISKHLIDATIATEDATFYTNPGVDAARIAGAALGNAQEGDVVSGASTITMQLARNLFLGDDQRYQQSMDRKMLEAGLAQEVTSLFSKDEILEMYLNLLNYGHMAYGPEAAAQVYFGKSAADLSPAEATLLAGIPQQPANLDLFTSFDAAKARQRVVLDMLVRHGFLSQTDADKIHAEPVTLNPAPDQVPNAAPHFTQYVWDVLDSRLGEGAAVRSGLAVTTTLDLKMQALAQGIVARKVKELKPKHDLNNAALVAMRPESGEILAMVGSADFADTAISGQVNVATSQRQPGSAIKPLVYATALNDDLISPATILWDVPVTYTVGNSMTYTPVNYDGKFHGPVTVRAALANSYNIPAVKLLDGVTVERMLKAAEAFGIRSLNRGKEWYGLSLTLGGGEMTLLELTSAYAALASGGTSRDPRANPGGGRRPGPAGGSRCTAEAGRTGAGAGAGSFPGRRVPGDGHPQRQCGAHAHVRRGQPAQAQPARRGQNRHDRRFPGQLDGRLSAPPGGGGVGGQHRRPPDEEGQRHRRRRADLARFHGRGARRSGVARDARRGR